MAQSLSFILVHIIFSTKERRPFIIESVRPKLHAYLAGVVRASGSECYRVGGIDDHVHLAVRLKSTATVSGIIEELKTTSSKWIKPLAPGLETFAWQSGYGAFSVSPRYLKELVTYIDSQEEHHRRVTFQDEFRKFLQEYEVQYEEQYVWG